MERRSSHITWKWQHPCQCDNCQRYPLVSRVFTHHFNMETYWGDYVSQTYCFRCLIHAKVASWKARIKALDLFVSRSNDRKVTGFILFSLHHTRVLSITGGIKYRKVRKSFLNVGGWS